MFSLGYNVTPIKVKTRFLNILYFFWQKNLATVNSGLATVKLRQSPKWRLWIFAFVEPCVYLHFNTNDHFPLTFDLMIYNVYLKIIENTFRDSYESSSCIYSSNGNRQITEIYISDQTRILRYFHILQEPWSEGIEVLAMYSFRGNSSEDLPFSRKDVLTIVRPTRVS